MNSILDNAILSIQLGVEDYKLSDEDKRRVVSAIRNIYAGVLLLFKEKLYRLSPDKSNPILLKKKFVIEKNKNGDIEIKGKGKNTVGYEEIKERFKQLEIYVDWKRVEETNKIRNAIEHYKTDASPERVRQILWNLLPVIRDFITKDLQYEPVKLLGKDTWEILLEVEEIYSKERKYCEEEVDKLVENETLKSLLKEEGRCINCSSDLIYPKENLFGLIDTQFFCKSCGSDFCYEPLEVEEMVSNCYSFELYRNRKYGEPFLYMCCECGTETVIADEENGDFKCLVCGGEFNYICDRCQEAYYSEEYIGMCNDCWKEKIDEE